MDLLKSGTDLISDRQEVKSTAMGSAVSFLVAGEKVFWVDGGNSFNPYMITAAAKSLAINPHPLLRRLFVARAFTVHQLVSMITKHLGPALDKHTEALGVIYDPLALCCNPDVPKTEADRAVKQIDVEIRRIRKKGHRLIVASPDAVPAIHGSHFVIPDLIRNLMSGGN